MQKQRPGISASIRQIILYGLREIAFIFIGITMAIGFDNWNKEREERKFEKDIVSAIAKELGQTMAVWDRFQRDDKKTFKAQSTVLREIDQRQVTLPRILSLSISELHTYHAETSSFETLRQRGFDVIRDPVIRQQIIAIYTDQFEFAREINETEIDFQNNQMRPFLDHWIKLTPPVDSAAWFPWNATAEWIKEPGDRDKEVINFLNNRHSFSFYHRQQIESIASNVNELIVKLDSLNTK